MAASREHAAASVPVRRVGGGYPATDACHQRTTTDRQIRGTSTQAVFGICAHPDLYPGTAWKAATVAKDGRPIKTEYRRARRGLRSTSSREIDAGAGCDDSQS
jgi:hypothetical protein